mmetsp:Transcript_45024/g.104270  ORF Transcript_45024/g.104270 Transcript_45024/m.104270 type:complete len:391 (-) Transcript_45024:17-1189(-)
MHGPSSVPLSVTIPAVVGLKGAPGGTHAGSPIAAASLGCKVQQRAISHPVPNLSETVQAFPQRQRSAASLLADPPRHSQPFHESNGYDYDDRSSFGSEGAWQQQQQQLLQQTIMPTARRGSQNSMAGSACGGYVGSDYAVHKVGKGSGRASLAGSVFGESVQQHRAAAAAAAAPLGVTQVVNQVQQPPQRTELADALGVTMPVQDVDDTPQRLQWQVGSILEAFSESQGRWFVGQVTHASCPPDAEGLLVQFYVDDVPKKKGMFRHDRRNLAPLGTNTKGELPPGFEVRASKSRPGRSVLLDATTGNKYDSVELAWRVHFNRLQQASSQAPSAAGRPPAPLQKQRQSGPQLGESHSFDLAYPYMAPMPSMAPPAGPMAMMPTKPPRTAYV